MLYRAVPPRAPLFFLDLVLSTQIAIPQGYKCVITMADSFSVERRKIMRGLGAQVGPKTFGDVVSPTQNVSRPACVSEHSRAQMKCILRAQTHTHTAHTCMHMHACSQRHLSHTRKSNRTHA